MPSLSRTAYARSRHPPIVAELNRQANRAYTWREIEVMARDRGLTHVGVRLLAAVMGSPPDAVEADILAGDHAVIRPTHFSGKHSTPYAGGNDAILINHPSCRLAVSIADAKQLMRKHHAK